MAFAKVLRNTNLANLIVWSYWWPIIIIISIFWGRLWCTVCPIELITTLSARIGMIRIEELYRKNKFKIRVQFSI
ncbi:4Fe-4S binding protein [candidate division KSB1 bacterium]|nr:4Fe-4S binding protein [candidate division KSB1 bacterium]